MIDNMLYNKDLEEIIAATLFHNTTLIDLDIVDASDFATDIKSYIRVMINIRKNEGLIDETTIGKSFELPSDEDILKFNDYVVALKSYNGKRKLQMLPKLVTKLVTSDASYEDIIVKLGNTIEKMQINKHDDNSSLVENLTDSYEEQLFNPDTGTKLSTGVPELDRALCGGFKKGQLITIAGDTGNCKSTLMYNIALFNALIGKKVIIYSYEITTDEMMDIFVSMLTGINSIIIEAKKFTPEMTAAIKIAVSIIKKIPLYIFDVNATLSDIKLFGTRVKPDMVLIDYLQLMPEVDENQTRSLEKITRQHKILAKKDRLDTVLIQLSQFSRPSKETIDNPKRELASLKGASSIEQDSNIVIFTRKKEKLEIDIKKNRGGETGKFEVALSLPTHTVGTGTILEKRDNYRRKKK